MNKNNIVVSMVDGKSADLEQSLSGNSQMLKAPKQGGQFQVNEASGGSDMFAVNDRSMGSE